MTGAQALAGRTALVTGAGRGIGRATALELAQLGASVVLLARSEDELAETAAQVRSLGGAAETVPADLSRLEQIEHYVARARDAFGPIDILLNNAAVVWPLGPTATIDMMEWASAISMNVVAQVRTTVAVLPDMLERGWGRIVNVSSGVAGHPAQMTGGNAYVTGKAALEAHTINLATELASTGVTVNAFRPGTVDTAMQAWIREQEPERIGPDLHAKFAGFHAAGTLIGAKRSAQSVVTRLVGDATGEVWDVSDPL